MKPTNQSNGMTVDEKMADPSYCHCVKCEAFYKEKEVRDNRRRHLQRDLNAAFTSDADWFTAQLFHLIAKADLQNRERIRKGFPEEVATFEDWTEGSERGKKNPRYIP